MGLQTLKQLYEHELRDLHDSESQMIDLLPRMAEVASDGELKEILKSHGEQSRRHRERLEQILKGLDAEPDDVPCQGMRGILSEASRLMDADDASDAVRDAGLLAIAQKAEHYEMAGYGALRTYAELLGEREAREALQKTLDEEGSTDDRLSGIAMKSINASARA